MVSDYEILNDFLVGNSWLNQRPTIILTTVTEISKTIIS